MRLPRMVGELLLKMGIGLTGDRLPGLLGRGFAPVGGKKNKYENIFISVKNKNE